MFLMPQHLYDDILVKRHAAEYLGPARTYREEVMKDKRPIILLEFNELTPQLMEQFIVAGHLPNFAQLRDESQAYITDAEEQAPRLEPWIQWITVHCGMRYADHKVFSLGDNADIPYPSLWDIASNHGDTVWVCGSMNANYAPGVRGAVLPDPWSVHVQPSDPGMLPYFEFVRTNVLEHTRDKVMGGAHAMRRFLSFMATHGLKASTLSAIVCQLASEKFRRNRWRRVALLDRLQFDVFGHYYKKLRPAFSTFFLNSTAHFQHMYWRQMMPELFSVKPSEAERHLYGDAVLYGYQQMDRLVGKMRHLVGENAILAFATGLSQQPCLKYEGSGGKTFYRPVDFNDFLKFAGIDPHICQVEPVMSEELHIRFSNEVDSDSAARQLGELKVGERAAMNVARTGKSLLIGCGIFEELPADAVLQSATGHTLFTNVFYHVDLKKSGMHHPDGLFWVRVPGMAGVRHTDKVPIVDVAPTLLVLLELPIPAAMPGRALIGQEKREYVRDAARV